MDLLLKLVKREFSLLCDNVGVWGCIALLYTNYCRSKLNQHFHDILYWKININFLSKGRKVKYHFEVHGGFYTQDNPIPIWWAWCNFTTLLLHIGPVCIWGLCWQLYDRFEDLLTQHPPKTDWLCFGFVDVGVSREIECYIISWHCVGLNYEVGCFM